MTTTPAFGTNDQVALTNAFFDFKSGRKVRKGTKGTVEAVSQTDTGRPLFTVRFTTGATVALHDNILRLV